METQAPQLLWIESVGSFSNAEHFFLSRFPPYHSCSFLLLYNLTVSVGLPLTMEPNYETFECQFSFGKTPTTETESVAVATPCLHMCPTAGSLRKFHDDGSSSKKDSSCPFLEEAL